MSNYQYRKADKESIESAESFYRKWYAAEDAELSEESGVILEMMVAFAKESQTPTLVCGQDCGCTDASQCQFPISGGEVKEEETKPTDAFDAEAMAKVQADIDSVMKGSIVDKSKLLGISSIGNDELCDIVQNACQLIGGFKPDAEEGNYWSEWDESVFQSLIGLLRTLQPVYGKLATPSVDAPQPTGERMYPSEIVEKAYREGRKDAIERIKYSVGWELFKIENNLITS